MLGFCCSTNYICVNPTTKPLKHKVHFSVAYYFLSIYFQTSQAAEMLLKHCKRQY